MEKVCQELSLSTGICRKFGSLLLVLLAQSFEQISIRKSPCSHFIIVAISHVKYIGNNDQSSKTSFIIAQLDFALYEQT